MRNQLLMVLLVLVGFISPTSVDAQSLSMSAIEQSVKEDGRYAILVANARHFQAAVMTGEALKASHPLLDFEIVLIGPVVKDLAIDESLKPFVKSSEQAGIRIVVCELAMNHLGMKSADYDSYISFTPNGFTYIFGLQESGFKTITL